MLLLNDLNFDLPLQNPVIIFSLVLFIILFAPILFNKIKVPHIIGLILAGVIVGPYGLNLLMRDSSIVLFGTVGLLYIMFLAGLELDLTEFKKNRVKILTFGFFTFVLPLTLGTLASYFLLKFGFLTSVLMGSMISTHTLIAYPIASKYGVSRSRSASIAVGGTMITDILALLLLAIIAGTARESASNAFWVQLSVSTVVFVGIVFFVLPILIRWFFKRFDDSISQYIFVLAIVFLSAFLAEAAGLEAIIGAFFSGLVLNNFVPHTSPLMNRIEFVGNAIFIPFFLISVGMLVDLTVFTKGFGPLKVAGVIIAAAVLGKFSAAWITRKIFKMNAREGTLMYGLSGAHAAATLAIILVGFNIIIGETATGEPIRLLGEDVLNGAVLLILVSCAVSSFVVEKAAKKMAAEEEAAAGGAVPVEGGILISVAVPESVPELIDLGLMMRPKKSALPVYALHIVSDDGADNAAAVGKKMLDNAVKQAAATENEVVPLSRYDNSVVSGITYTVREKHITDLIIGLHRDADMTGALGKTTPQLLNRIFENVFIYKPVRPINTLSRMVVVVTPGAEEEPGFESWHERLMTLAKEAGLSVAFYASPHTNDRLGALQAEKAHSVSVSHNAFTAWEDFLFFTGVLSKQDLFAIVTSRRGQASYLPASEKLPYYLTTYFQKASILLVYPQQPEHELPEEEGVDTQATAALPAGKKRSEQWLRLAKQIFGKGE